MKLLSPQPILVVLLLILILAVPPFMAGAQEDSAKKPNILWIVCEDISPYLGIYGNTELKTPNLDQLAAEGVRYTNVFTAAGVCAPSRSSIITGMYPMSIGTQHMRTLVGGEYSAVQAYSAVIPEGVKCFPEYMRMDGYYCTNNEKQDYQFRAPVTVWDENSLSATWRNRPPGKPFFSVFNFAITHESQLFMRQADSLWVDPGKVTVPPIYPDTKTVRNDIARLFTNIEILDSQVGEILDLLKKDGLYDNTIIIFYSDHGGALPWMKREVIERGTHIPFIVRFPGGKNGGTINRELVSAVDFAPTMLSLAGIRIPAHIQGQAFLGAQKSKTPRKYVFAARDRMDTEYDRVRSVRDDRYRYVYNYMPEKPYYQQIEYRENIPMMKEILAMKEEGTLNPVTMTWFDTKPVEEFYDEVNDPYDLINLAVDPGYRNKLIELRTAFQDWTHSVGDMSETPEKEMISKMWNGADQPPATAAPRIKRTAKDVEINCDTKGASVGYIIVPSGEKTVPGMEPVVSWDFGVIFRPELKGKLLPANPVWNIYKEGDIIKLNPGDTLKVNAMRIGYQTATVDYVY
jgi:N-sulfoglucosamine sulfohydrolase